MRSIHLLVVLAIGFFTACSEIGPTERSQRQPLVEHFHLQRILVMEHPPVIAAERKNEMSGAERLAGRADSAEWGARDSARWTGIDALPFLTSTDAGMRFLSAAGPRALARGRPASACPVMIAETRAGARSVSSRVEVAASALEACLAALGPDLRGCGCQIIALDDMVTIPVGETGYATGATARLRAPSLQLDLLLVAEEHGNTVLLRDLRGPVALLTHEEGSEQVRLSFAENDTVFTGRRIPVGFRRGRIAERIYAEDDDGNRVSLLIGFEPDELAGGAAAWLAWPGG